MRPRVTIVMATYNHSAYVGDAIESVLAQEDVEFEFLIADDGSSDATPDRVADHGDQRVSFTAHPGNRGAGVVTNELLGRATGDYVALMNSDDIWLGTDKLASQVAILDEHPSVGATFGRARFIDYDGRPLPKAAIPFGDVFDQQNRSQGAWLRRFFDQGNCLCHPTMLIRRECYEAVGYYDNRLRQLPDFDMWVRLLKRYQIHVSSRDLIAFRHLPGENASAVTAANSRRAVHELYFILRRFFDGMGTDLLREGFSDLLVLQDVPDEIHADIEKALLYRSLDGPAAHVREMIALEKLYDLLESDVHRLVLQEDYEFDDRSFQAVAGEGASDGLDSDALERQVVAMNETLRAVENSVSWRVTRPLRSLGRLRRRS
jgi:glycosyltransferase involved in cell wall biosynthesis